MCIRDRVKGTAEGGDPVGGGVGVGGVGDPVPVVGEGGTGAGAAVLLQVVVEPGEDAPADVAGLQGALGHVEFAGRGVGHAAAVAPGLPHERGRGALGLERAVTGGRLVEVEQAVGLPLDEQGGRPDVAEVGRRGDAAGVGEQPCGAIGRVAAGVEGAYGVADVGDEVQTGQRIDPGGIEVGDGQRLALPGQVEAVGPLPLERAGHLGGADGVVRVQRVGEVVPRDERGEGVEAVVGGGGGQLDRAAVGSADHADAGVAGGVQGDEVGGGPVVGGALAAEEVDQPGGGPAVDAGIVHGDQAAALAEAEAGVDEGDVTAFGEDLADGVGGAVRLAAAEAVGAEDGGCGVGVVDPGGAVQVGVDRTAAPARRDGELQRGDGVPAARAGRAGGEREGGGEGRAEERGEGLLS